MKTISYAKLLVIIAAISAVAASCSPDEKKESLAQYYKNRRNINQTFFKISSPDYYRIYPLVISNDGITPSDKKSIKMEISKKSPEECVDDLIEFRTDIISLSMTQYLHYFKKLKNINPAVFAITGYSSGNIVISGDAKNDILSVKIHTLRNSEAQAFASSLFVFAKGKRPNFIKYDSYQKAINKCAGEICAVDLFQTRIPDGAHVFLSTRDADRFEPYMLIARSFFVQERKSELSALVGLMYDGTWKIRNGELPAFEGINPENISLLYPAAKSENDSFFAPQSGKTLNFAEAVYARTMHETRREADISMSFSSYIVASLSTYKEKQYATKHPLTTAVYGAKIETPVNAFNDDARQTLRAFSFYARMISNPSVTISAYNYPDYQSAASALDYSRKKMILNGINSSSVKINAAQKSDKYAPYTLTLEASSL